MDLITVIEWIGSIVGIVGAILLALNFKYSGHGFIFFLVSSILFIWFGLVKEAYGLVFMQSSYFIINVIGIYRWFGNNKKQQ